MKTHTIPRETIDVEFTIEKEQKINNSIILEAGDTVRVYEGRNQESLITSAEAYIKDQLRSETEEDIGYNLVMAMTLAINRLENKGTITPEQVKKLYSGMEL